MDPVNIILTAFGTALATGGQAALNDTAKEAFEHLKKRIVQAFSGRQKDLTILEEYEHDPDTWEKPFKDVLVKTGLSQDEATIKIAQHLIDLMSPQMNMRDQLSIQHHGPGYGSVYGSNYGTINISPTEDKLASGKTVLARGRDALWRKEYDTAKRLLEEASHLLSEDQLPLEGAQVRYFLALALLGSKRPYSAAYQTLLRIEQILRGAITLYPSPSYLYTLALIKQDYSRNGFAHFATEANELIHQMRLIPPSAHDQENLELLSHCQSRLLQDAKAW